ncbi:MAG: PAS domain-containing protein [Burkholderiaceae bacterium]|nr:PAS domain-containing protein [Rhodoferax sp.]
MTLRFMQGGGDMGAMLRAHPWAESPMGLPAHWPSQLKTLVGLMLNAPQPMFAVWGPEQRMFYNDGYAEILGGHHPALDQPFLDVWSEIRSDLEPIMARAYAGEPIYMDDIELTMRRHGHDEETHFSFFYAPVRGDQGEVLGVFCACTEITQEVKARRERTAELDRLREMFTSSPSFVAVLRGPDHRFELTNPAYLRLIAQRDVIGMPVRAALPELEGQGFFELLDTVYRTGETHSGRAARVSLVAEPGTELEERVVDFIYQPMRGADGKVNGIFVEGVDVTEVVTQAQVLRESEEKFRSFAQLAPNHMWTSPADGQLDWFNEQTLRYSGMDMAALCGTGWATLVHPDDLARAKSTWAAALRSGQNYEVEFRIRRADGVYRWHLVRALPVRNTGGAIVRWVGTNTDIEDQRADRDKLRAINATLERRVDERTRERERMWTNSPDLMAMIDEHGSFVDVNPAWKCALGWDREQVVGRRIDALIHPQDHARTEDALARATVGVLPTFECRVLHADGSHRIVAWTAAPDGKTVFAFGRDITADRERSDALAKAEEQLRQAQKMEAIGKLTGGIAHDFNNMLASIYGSIQLMQRKLAAGKQDGFEKLLERASASSQRAAALTQRLLAFARRQALETRRVDVCALIDSLDDMMRRTLGPHITLQIRHPQDAWPARIDSGQLESSLLNLVINARDAMPDGGELGIEVANCQIDDAYAATQVELAPGEYVAVSVGDSGVGMSESVITRAFEPFYTTKPIGQGTGLGLSMVYGFVKQAGGHVRIQSEPGRGTTVTLYLPRDLSDGEAEPAPARVAVEGAQAGESILVVEDEPSVREIIVSVLAELGYAYAEAGDAESALVLLDGPRHFDLLVSDVGLPGLNGRQLAEIAMGKRPELKVLFVTGYAEQAAVQSRFLSDNMQMITKPFVVDELAQRIRTILRN